MTSSWYAAYAAGAALFVLLSGCDRSAPSVATGQLSSPQGPAAVSVIRIPAGGGRPSLYRVPTLDRIDWSVEDQFPAVRQVVGADPEQGLVFALDRARNLVALDLDTRRVRTQLRQVTAAIVGPDGVVYAVDTGSNVTRLVRRAPVHFRAKLQGKPRTLHAAVNGALLAEVGERSPALEVLTADLKPSLLSLPRGDLAATYVGDLLAVAADTAVVLYGYTADPKWEPRSVRVSGGARAVAFAPSGHLLYLVGDTPELVILDRYHDEVLERIQLPGPARDLRSDFYGRWLLVQPETGDSVWIIDVGTRRYLGAVAAPWSAHFPIVAGPSTLLARHDDDLVALDLGKPRFPETGRVSGGADDFWLPIAWYPDAESLDQPAPSDTIAPHDEPIDSLLDEDVLEPRPEVYLQLSSSQNPNWADQWAAQLREAGLPASVLPPSQADEAYRVVLGPYPTREQAEEISRGLGMPSFVITTPGE